jgi:hypothetical protein
MRTGGADDLLQHALNLIRLTATGAIRFSKIAQLSVRPREREPVSQCMYDERVKAPTGGPNRWFGQTQWHTWFSRVWLSGGCAALSYFLFLGPAAAAAQLRVTGTLTIEASASQLPGATEVRARLIDDAGHAVPGVEVRIKPLNLNEPRAARDCHARLSQIAATAFGAYAARSNGAGALCVHFDGTPERAEFELSFSDPAGLYGTANRRVIADSATRNVEMAFAPEPSVLALESDAQIISIVTRPTPALATGETIEKLNVALSLRRPGQTAEQVSEAPVELGSNLEFRVASRTLGAPGPIEISAEFSGSPGTRPARIVAHATATAEAVLSLVEPVPASHPESGVLLRVRVSSVAGAVPSGSVQARAGSVSLGAARVSAGLAELNLRLEERVARAQPVELRYVADDPWWLPTPALSVAIPILPPSRWRRLAWVAAVTALGSWLLSSWQRPRRRERAAPMHDSRRAVRAPIELVQIGDAGGGWRGQVLDAHDRSPIAGALVLVRVPSFGESGVIRRASCDAQGAFALEGVGPIGQGAAIEVRAPYHSPLAATLPQPGTLLLSLTSRRRTLLSRFVDWVSHDGGWDRRAEATPGEVARKTDRKDVTVWASAVDEAAFGPEPLSEAKDHGVVAREPAHKSRAPARNDRT